MSRSSRHKEKHGKNSEPYQDNNHEGTAARTRPFSFDEIMLRRKNKKLSEIVKEGAAEAEKALGEIMVASVSDRYESERDFKHHKESSCVVEKLSSNKFAKLTSKNKENDISRSEEKVVKHKNVASPVTERKVKAEMKKDASIKAKHITNISSRKKNSERSNDRFDNETEGKKIRDLIGKSSQAELSSGKFERESKRKYQNGDDKKNKDRKASKRSELRNDSDIQEIKEHKESSKFHQEDKKVKRRRSRSRDCEDRSRRSVSLSPRARKYTTYHGREHGKPSSHGVKARSGRHHYDVDRDRISSNGTDNHYRRYSGSTSGLGGYSPRKRKAPAVTKTPSPTNMSPGKKNAKWDLAPAGTGGISSMSVASNFQSVAQIIVSSVHEVAASTVKTPTGASYNAISARQSTSVDSVQLTQATRPMRRIYVENVPVSVSERDMIECFNSFLLSSGFNHIRGTEPCISCIIHKEKGHAFVEFLTPEDASAALSFDGCAFGGSILKIRRPKDFVEVITGELEKSVASVNAVSDDVKDSPNKIFVGGISKALSSEMFMEIASAYGPLKAYHFLINEDLNEPCAFLEYVDPSVTTKVCAALNGMKLGGQVITAVQAFPDILSLGNTVNPPFYGIPEHAKPLLQKPTQVLKLKNVFNLEVLSFLSEAEVEEILEDVRLECARFGTVKSVHMMEFGANLITGEEISNLDNVMGGGAEEVNAEMDELEVVNHASGVAEVENSINGGKAEEVDKIEGGKIRDVKPVMDCMEDELSEQSNNVGVEDLILETISEENCKILASQGPLNGKTDDHDEKKVCDIVERENVGMGNVSIETDGGERTQEEPVEEHEWNVEYKSEAGCVFVEYGRTESACMAAHCLHGRLFANQVVSVEYVPLDDYHARFLK
ncbi:splicing factor U2af large subunit B isoform X1 [Carica papaya]|uniref:splicing factor U2af large subunit B isoform X1 n=1 Tax=Carica papaya TaxID=3649 RepID=UPI000B8CC9A3|nr:splicing factor U2af large subunit B isoform X1 [Carica papaya]XP_021899563.1 splicing factor U2af large subunit B isoform X1 [Carica papaya]